MNSVTNRVTGVNVWFLIEILSFYGYIFSAILFIFTNSIISSLGKKIVPTFNPDPIYRHDYLMFYRKDCDWAAFVQILFNVNIGLIGIDNYITFKDEVIDPDEVYPHPLKHITYLLLVNHILQMIFLKDFYDEERKVSTKNQWVWLVQVFSYTYIMYIYIITDARVIETS